MSQTHIRPKNFDHQWYAQKLLFILVKFFLLKEDLLQQKRHTHIYRWSYKMPGIIISSDICFMQKIISVGETVMLHNTRITHILISLPWNWCALHVKNIQQLSGLPPSESQIWQPATKLVMQYMLWKKNAQQFWGTCKNKDLFTKQLILC